MDRGANGGLAGNDVSIIHERYLPRFIYVSTINKYHVKELEIVTSEGVVPSQQGEVIAILY